MREGWRETTMGEVFARDLDKVPVDPSVEYRLAGVFSFGKGLFRRNPLLGSQTSYSHFNRLSKGQFVMSKLKAWEGAIAIVDESFDGYVLSPEFPTYTLDGSKITPSFLRLVTMQPHLWQQLAAESRGVGGRKERVHQLAVLNVSILLPPLAEQRRIVDLIAAVDAAIEAAALEREAADCAYQAILNDAVDGDRPTDRLAEMVEWARAGGTPSRKQADYFGGPIPWLKSGEVADRSLLKTAETITERALAESAAWVVPTGSVLLAMYGATAGKVGFTTFPLATNQAVLAMIGKAETLDNRWLYHLLRSRSEHLKSQATGAAQPNLSKERVLSEELPRVGFAEQKNLSALLDEFLGVVDSTTEFIDKAQRLRSALLADLLSGDHEIPDSYDELLSA